MKSLSECFAIDIYAYAVMSNHAHSVLFVDPERVDGWSDDEVIRRWKTVGHWRNPDKPLKIPAHVPQKSIEMWRKRLSSVSWYMRTLKEPMARIANAEDDCTGRFWEGRFKSIPLLDDAAVVTCMAYVDLNPIRAGLADSVEESDYTSIQERICNRIARLEAEQSAEDDAPLTPIHTQSGNTRGHLSITLNSYLDLVRSSAGARLAEENAWRDEIVQSLGMKQTGWGEAVTQFLSLFRSAAGSEAMFAEFMELTGRVRRQDAAARRIVYN